VLLLQHWRQRWQKLAQGTQLQLQPQQLPLLPLQFQPLCAWLELLMLHLMMAVLLVLWLLL
jgi:hypothetical protein